MQPDHQIRLQHTEKLTRKEILRNSDLRKEHHRKEPFIIIFSYAQFKTVDPEPNDGRGQTSYQARIEITSSNIRTQN